MIKQNESLNLQIKKRKEGMNSMLKFKNIPKHEIKSTESKQSSRTWTNSTPRIMEILLEK